VPRDPGIFWVSNFEGKTLGRPTCRLSWSPSLPAPIGCETQTRIGNVFEKKLERQLEKEAFVWSGP
jgi:hypothetical protein